MSTKILITGASGFIGTSLVEYLSNEFKLYCLSRVHIKNSLNNVILVDLSKPGFSRMLPDDIDCVIHLAQSRAYRDFPGGVGDMVKINIDATAELLEWARIQKVKHFIFTSTANVYSSSDSLVTETSQTCPDSFYGCTKLSAEYLCRQYSCFYKVTVLRLFTVYGPKKNTMLISNIINSIINGDKIHLSQNIGINLTPIYLEDLLLIIKSLLNPPTPLNYTFEVFNLCGNKVTSLREIADTISLYLGCSINLSLNTNEVASFCGLNLKIRNSLPFVRFTEIQQGIQQTVQFSIENK